MGRLQLHDTGTEYGRASMFASMSYIIHKLSGKISGFLAQSINLKYAECPRGLAAISEVQAAEMKMNRLSVEQLTTTEAIGVCFQDDEVGSDLGDLPHYTDSPLRALENELGARELGGVWESFGLSSDGAAAACTDSRAAEIRTDHASMFATMGCSSSKTTGRFLGHLPPCLGLKYEDVPNGLGVISTVPLAGWFQIVLSSLHFKRGCLQSFLEQCRRHRAQSIGMRVQDMVVAGVSKGPFSLAVSVAGLCFELSGAAGCE